MGIRIYSKKTFAIGPGALRNGTMVNNFVTVPLAIQDMPEIYADDPTFKLAVQAGDIVIMEGVKNVEKKVEEVSQPEPEDPVKAFYNSLKGKDTTEIRKLANKYGSEFVEGDKLSANKKRVLEAYKLSLADDKSEDDSEDMTAIEE